MADYVMPDGREITFDLTKITRKEYKGLFDIKESETTSDETLAKAAGILLEDIDALSFVDYRRFSRAFFMKCREPLSDPNALGSAPS